jgi:hypothetical protein
MPGVVYIQEEPVRLIRNRLAGLLVACLAISQVAGCCCLDPCATCPPDRCCRPCPHQVAAPACFGYHSTCWSAWPEACETCPPPASITAATVAGEEPIQESEPSSASESIPAPAHPQSTRKKSPQVKLEPLVSLQTSTPQPVVVEQ